MNEYLYLCMLSPYITKPEIGLHSIAEEINHSLLCLKDLLEKRR